MTTARKVVLIIATVLVLGGAALCMATFAMADFRLENLSNTPRDYVSNTKTLATEAESPHTNIIVNDDSESVRFEPTDGDAIEIVYWTSNDKSMSIDDTEGTVSVTGAKKNAVRFMFMYMGFEDLTTVVKVPRSYTGSITVAGGSYNATIMSVEGLTTVPLESDSGRITLTDIGAQSVTVKSLSGSIAVANVTATENFTAAASSGEITATGIEATTVETSTNSGRQNLGLIHAQTINARSSSGGIDASTLTADNIALEASSGRVGATVAGNEADYLIEHRRVAA